MADFVPPSGPPPPKLPEGWKAVWNDQYKEWFYVNLHTKESTWEKPTAPAAQGSSDGTPSGPPPGYSSGPNDPVVTGDSKKPISGETDEQLAARLQAQEDSTASTSTERGAAEEYYSQAQQYPQRPAGYNQQATNTQGNVYGQGQYQGASQGQYQGQYQAPIQGQYQSPQYPPSGQVAAGATGAAAGLAGAAGGKGLLSKLMGKTSRPTGQQQTYGPPPQQGYGYGQQQAGYGQYQQGYAAAPVAAAQPQRKQGMGALGAGALGVGGGLLGGMLLENVLHHGDGGGGGWGGGGGGWGGDDGGPFGGGDDGRFGGDDGRFGGDDGGFGGDGGDFGGGGDF